MAKYFAIKGQNDDSHGFDHRLCEWNGVEKVGDKFKRANLLGEDALAAYIEASEEDAIELEEGLLLEDATSSGMVGASLKDNKSAPAKKSGKKAWTKPWEKPVNVTINKVDPKTGEPDEDKANKPKVDPLTGESDKPLLADCEESVDPRSSKKSTMRTPKFASPKGPSLGESIPDAVANMLTDDPDIFNI